MRKTKRARIPLGLNKVEREKLEAIANELVCSLGEAARHAIREYTLRNQKDANNARKN